MRVAESQDRSIETLVVVEPQGIRDLAHQSRARDQVAWSENW